MTDINGTQTGNVADAGKTGIDVGICVGYQVLNPSPRSWYKLDLNLDVSYTSLNYLEAGYNSSVGAGSFSANGLSGGSTNIISFDIMPIHRLNIPSLRLVSPFVGIGVGLNYMMTKDLVTVPPKNQDGTATGKNDFKIGLAVFYGVVLQVTDLIQPYLQFKHLVPFGTDTEFTTDWNSNKGGGSQKAIFSIADVPGYFSLTAGCRFSF